ncbi:MAG: UDP-N-acetylmuramoyl-tripeptide--D-alanyl-D-alanine ligase [Acidobacteriota bacterium]
MAVLALRSVAEATGGTVLCADPELSVERFAIDSRSIRGGELFFAIRGPHHDGHRFVDDVFRKGAAAAVVSRDIGVERPAVRVADTTAALRVLARSVRETWGGTVVGVTGSCGKTTSKEMIRVAVEGSRPLLASRGNLNNLYGLPLTLLRVLPEHEVAVLEMGISTPDEMTELARIAGPDVMVMLNVAAVHLAHFESVDAIATAKGAALAVMGPRGTFVYNQDDARLRRLARGFAGRTLSFGLDPGGGADVVGVDVDESGEGIAASVRVDGAEQRLVLPVAGRHNLMNALAALAAARALDVDLSASVRRLASFIPPGQRGDRLRLTGDLTVWDESYNSNPEAMRAVLATLRVTRPIGRRVLVCGDMKELGADEADAHRRLAPRVADAGVDLFVGVGPLAALTVDSLESEPAVATHACDDARDAAVSVPGWVRDGDLVVVKGSRSMNMERVVEALVAARGRADA